MTGVVLRAIGGVFVLVVCVPLLLAGASNDSATATALPTAAGPPLDPTRYVFPLIGDASYGPYHHDYPATDIFAAVGTPAVACTRAQVLHVSREDIGKGGLSVTLLGDDGWRYYYAHLSVVAARVAPGVVVEKGNFLGRSGNSGNARFTEPHLHFGISLTGPVAGEISPYPYLQVWPHLTAPTR